MSIQEKPLLRVIAGGRMSENDKRSFFAKRTSPKNFSFESEKLQYRKILASRYVERMDNGVNPRLDWREVVKDKALLIEQAIADGTTSKEVQFALNELKSRFAIVRKEAALYIAYIANDPEIFGIETSRKMVDVLLDNSSEESNHALRCLGFSAQEILELRFADAKRKCEMIELIIERNNDSQK